MLPRPFKDLEWHKGKKTQHRRRLSLLRQGPADHQRVAIFSVVPRTPLKNGVLWCAGHCCRGMATADGRSVRDGHNCHATCCRVGCFWRFDSSHPLIASLSFSSMRTMKRFSVALRARVSTVCSEPSALRICSIQTVRSLSVGSQ